MKNKKNLIITIIIIVLVALAISIAYLLFNDKNKLTILERSWINDNLNTVQNVNIINNVNVFGKNGSGVYYDFLNDFSKEYSLNINPITFNTGSNPAGITLGYKKYVSGNDVVIYADHYVLVGKEKETINSESSLAGKNIGILSDDLSYVSTYLSNTSNITFTQFNTINELYTAMQEETVGYMIVPLIEYLDGILSENYNVIYHFSDVNIYYTLQLSDGNLSSIIKKYYATWKDNFNKYYNAALNDTFTTALKISDTEIDAMQSVEYNYGFVNASPYEVISGGKYGGIAAVILSDFSTFAGVDFNFIKYNNVNKFADAIKDGKVDLYFDYYNNNDAYNATSGIPISYVIAAKRDNSEVIKSVKSLIGKTIYVEEGSKIKEYLGTINGITIETFDISKDLGKLNKKDVYLVLDKNTFDYYQANKLSNYTARYSSYINNEYTFKVRINSALYKMLDRYVSILDTDKVILDGISNHYDTMKSGTAITKVAEYFIYIVIIVIVTLLIVLKRGKKITIAKKIKKDEKIKFIDQLTSLKNRNFLSENIGVWTNNTIYPQTIIVIDLNKVQEINDLYGYEEGDKQIKACANVLVKTQLDNSEILRTDGNEFVVYLVGYNQKQVTNYIHKLNKEIKKLPYDFGAEFGYSMINDNIKTIEDALNEAVESMKKQKDNHSNEK